MNSWWFLVSHQRIYHSLMQLLKMHYSRIILKEFNKPCEKKRKKTCSGSESLCQKWSKRDVRFLEKKKGSMFALSPSSWCRIFWDNFVVSGHSVEITKPGLLMGDDIDSGLWSMAICFDFCSTNVVQFSNWNMYFYQFWCHHPLITQLRDYHRGHFLV